MGNELPKSTQERITKQAKAYSGFDPDSDHTPYMRGLFQGYRTGATAETYKTSQAIEEALHKERNAMQAKMTGLELRYLKQIQNLLDVLQKIVHAPVPANEREYISWFVTAKNISGGAISDYEAENEVQQWKGEKEEIKDPCPNCGKELSRDRNLCCRECGKEVGDV